MIPIHHYGEIDGRLYLDVRLIEGRDLARAKPALPPQPAPPTQTRAGGISRGTIAPIVGAIALVVAAVGISALSKHGPSESSPTSSSSPTSLAPAYGTKIVVPFTGLNALEGGAVDTASNVYIADAANNRVLKLPAGSWLSCRSPA